MADNTADSYTVYMIVYGHMPAPAYETGGTVGWRRSERHIAAFWKDLTIQFTELCVLR